MPLATVDPDWDGDGTSVSAANEMLRTMLGMYYEVAFPDARAAGEDAARATRRSRSASCSTAAASRRRSNSDNVTVDRPDRRVNAGGIATADGAQHDVDVIIYGTGFQASDFLTPMKIEGTGGRDLREQWDGDARAYLGITVPHFPNLFSVRPEHQHRDQRQHRVLLRVRGAATSGASASARAPPRAIDPKAEVHEAYNDRDRRREPEDGVGRVVGALLVQEPNRPDRPELAVSTLEYPQQTRTVDLDDYELL